MFICLQSFFCPKGMVWTQRRQKVPSSKTFLLACMLQHDNPHASREAEYCCLSWNEAFQRSVGHGCAKQSAVCHSQNRSGNNLSTAVAKHCRLSRNLSDNVNCQLSWQLSKPALIQKNNQDSHYHQEWKTLLFYFKEQFLQLNKNSWQGCILLFNKRKRRKNKNSNAKITVYIMALIFVFVIVVASDDFGAFVSSRLLYGNELQ